MYKGCTPPNNQRIKPKRNEIQHAESQHIRIDGTILEIVKPPSVGYKEGWMKLSVYLKGGFNYGNG
jgi:hypothetical protein